MNPSPLFATFATIQNENVLCPAELLVVWFNPKSDTLTVHAGSKIYEVEKADMIIYGSLKQCVALFNEYHGRVPSVRICDDN